MTDKDAFGEAVNVGDYLVYATKGGQYSSFGMGLVTKFNPKGGFTMICVEPYGQTIPEYIKSHEDALVAAHKQYAGLKTRHPGEAWIERYNPDSPRYSHALTKTKRLDSASTCYRVPSHAIPPDVIQLLNQ